MIVALERYAPRFGLAGLVVMLGLCLLTFYIPDPTRLKWASPGAWVARWDFTPDSLGAPQWWSLALASAAGLFLELLIIRWISSEIRIFAYFKNFVLIACFLGFGLGFYLCRRRINLLALLVPLLTLVLFVKLPWGQLRELIGSLPVRLGAISEVQVWGVPSLPLNADSVTALLVAIAVIVPLFTFISFVFIPVGQLIGWYLEHAGDGITSYSVNILGSLAGILLFTGLSFLYQPPASWVMLAGSMVVVLLWQQALLRWSALAAFAACAGLAALGPPRPSQVYWSPYQKLMLTPRVRGNDSLGYVLSTNDSWYQQIIDLSPPFVAAHPDLFRHAPVEWNAYNLPYQFYPAPRSVLVLGAGMGNDVAAALRHGAERVVAVEIDPLILDLGEELHRERPYSSPRVERVVADARSYVQNTPERFDLIAFSLLDSHTTSSHFSNIRIDNYVYTVEALRAVRRLLKPDGVMIVKFQVMVPWIAGRLSALLQDVFGVAPVQIESDGGYTTPGRFFVAGSAERITNALANPTLAAYVSTHHGVAMEHATETTDNWPYFYQRAPGLPATVIVISAVLVLVCWLLTRAMGVTRGGVLWHFFFLGAGFLLLEAQIISKMALLFGTTWVVNSIVIAGLLVLVVGSNILVHQRPSISVNGAYVGIFGAIAVAYLVPIESFFFSSVWAKAFVATLVLCLPVFFAGIVFIRSFARAGFRGEALGSNLIGALVGGLLESLSMWTGLRSLLVLAGVLYAASWLALTRTPRARGVTEHGRDSLLRAG